MTSAVDRIDSSSGDNDEDIVAEVGYRGSDTFVVFTGEEVRPLSDMMSAPEIPDYVTDMADFMTVFGGLQSKVVFSTSEPDGLSITHVKLGPDFILLPHSHDTNCAYYVTAGEIRLSRRRLGPGAGFYVPANRRYAYVAGPEGAELLEVRDGTKFGMKLAPVPATRYAAIVANARAHNGWSDL